MCFLLGHRLTGDYLCVLLWGIMTLSWRITVSEACARVGTVIVTTKNNGQGKLQSPYERFARSLICQ